MLNNKCSTPHTIYYCLADASDKDCVFYEPESEDNDDCKYAYDDMGNVNCGCREAQKERNNLPRE